MKISRASLWIAVLSAVSICAIAGRQYFPESTFQLANDSRLPRWIVLPPGVTRSNVSVSMSYYVKPWGRTATFTIQGTGKPDKVSGKEKCYEPFHLKSSSKEPAADYPAYELITVNGISEVIEHRRAEPVFYISDDPEVRKAILASG